MSGKELHIWTFGGALISSAGGLSTQKSAKARKRDFDDFYRPKTAEKRHVFWANVTQRY